MKKIAAALILVLMIGTYASGGTIYIWTDENGVKRFSDQPPPEGIEDYQTAEGSVAKPDEGEREGLRQMLNEVEAQKRESERKEEAQAAARAEEQKREAEAQRRAETQAEREQLQKQISDLRKRALSPTFTQGMRDHQINEIQKQIDALD